jgi:hypothetical protein
VGGEIPEFKSYDGMPEKGAPLYNWQMHQLSNGAGSLNAKIRKELAENIGSILSTESVLIVWNKRVNRRG